MHITVVIEPGYRDALWCRQTLMGMEAACAQKKHTLHEKTLKAVLAEPEPQKLVIMVGTSSSWVPDALAGLKRRGIWAILVSYLDACTYDAAATVTMAHGAAMSRILHCFAHWGRTRTALYGMNPDSSADRVKCNVFALRGGSSDAVFQNAGSLQQCADAFFPQAGRFDGVILANDIVAVSFLRHAREQGFRVPEDLYAVSFGGCQVGRLTHPTLTSLTLNHRALGRQAVMAFAYLSRQKAEVHLDITVPADFQPGESTELRTPPPGEPDYGEPAAAVDFYQDPESDAILRLEAVLCQADDVDMALLRGLMRGESLASLAEATHVALGTVKYRFRKMLSHSGAPSRDALRSLLACHLGRL